MTKHNYRYLLPVIAIALLLVICGAIFGTQGVRAVAEDATYYIDSRLMFDAPALEGYSYGVQVYAWVSTNRSDWSQINPADYGLGLRYVDEDGTVETMPTHKGVYTAQLVALDDRASKLLNTRGVPYAVGDVLNSLEFCVASRSFFVVFAPESDIVYDGLDHMDAVRAGTKVYAEGQALSADKYTLDISKEGAAVATMVEPGIYDLTLTVLQDYPLCGISAGAEFTAAITVHRGLSSLISWQVSPIFEGRYSDLSGALAEDDAALSLARDEYYAPDLTGELVLSYPEKFSVSYWQGSVALGSVAPDKAGEYICRVTIDDDIPELGLVAGNYTDVEYRILPKPYRAVYDCTSVRYSHAFGDYLTLSGSLGVQLEQIVMSSSGELIEIYTKNGAARPDYYRLVAGTYQKLPDGSAITETGHYVAVFEMDTGATGSITGKEYFGDEAASFVIDEANSRLEWEFDVISPYTIEGLSASYVAGNGNTYFPTLRYAGVTATVANGDISVTFYDADGNSVLPELIDTLPGQYTAWASIVRADGWQVSGQLVAPYGESFCYRFEVAPEVQDSPVLTTYEESLLLDIYEALGLNTVDAADPAKLTLTFNVLHDGFVSVIDSADFMQDVGRYRLDVEVKYGLYKGHTFSINFENSASASISNVAIHLPNLDLRSQADYSGNAFVASVDFGEMPDGVSYSVIYERLDEDWVVCDYPRLPGTYRVRVRFNEPCSYFGEASFGSTVSKEFTINPLKLSVELSLADGQDSVYSGEAKTLTPKFLVNDRPWQGAVADSDWQLWQSKAGGTGPITYVDGPIINAGSYRLALVIASGDYRHFGLTALAESVLNSHQATLDELTGSFCSGGGITISKLAVSAQVTIPVEHKGMYRDGATILPQFLFTNASTGAEIAIPNSHYSVLCARGELGGTAYDSVLPVGVMPSETGRYQFDLILNEDFAANIYFENAAVEHFGAKEGVSYDAYYTTILDGKLRTFYAINPLPLVIKALPEYEESDLYFGQAHAAGIPDLTYWTVDIDGQEEEITSIDFASMLSIVYYPASTDHQQHDSQPILHEGSTVLPADYCFNPGSYLMRTTLVATPDTLLSELQHYHLAGSRNAHGSIMGEAETLALGVYADRYLDVLSAAELRIVFDRSAFPSFTADGTPKAFTLKFMSNGTDVTNTLVREGVTLAQMVEMKYYDALHNPLEQPPVAVGDYYVRVTFKDTLYRYRLLQWEGTYHPSDDAVPYVSVNDYVDFNFSVSDGIYLKWEWAQQGDTVEGSAHSRAYDGQALPYTLRFFLQSDHSITVNLMAGIDYDIWYYQVDTTGAHNTYTRLYEVPFDVGQYVAEVVFLHDLADYRVNIGTETYTVLSYTRAFEEDGFGRSLMQVGTLDAALTAEGRYLSSKINRALLYVDGISVQGKKFDNQFDATVSYDFRYVAESGAVVPSATVALDKLLSYQFQGRFSSVGVQSNIPVHLVLPLGEDFYLTLPHQSVAGTNGFAYLQSQLSEFAYAAKEPDTAALIEDLSVLLYEIYRHYDFYCQDVSASIQTSFVTVRPDDYSRLYDPYHVDNHTVTYRLSEADLALLRSLAQDENAAHTSFFVGSLSRENPKQSSVGEYDIIQGTLAFHSAPVQLADGTSCTLDELLTIQLRSAQYTILKRPIVIGIENDEIHRLYHEKDAVLPYIVVEGSLLFGDTLSYTGDRGEEREHSDQLRDPVGRYAINLEEVRVFNENIDVSDNYQISYRNAVYVIDPTSIQITPAFADEVHYPGDEFAPTLVSSLALESLQLKLTGNFGLIELPTEDSTVYRHYRMTLGSIGIEDADGEDVTANFSIAPLGDQFYTVSKYIVRLQMDAQTYTKVYGQPDPEVQLKDFAGSMASNGLHLGEGSLPSREEGENVGTYKYLATNNGSITVMRGDEDVTEYCIISVHEQFGQPISTYELSITPLAVTVTVREETVYKTSQPYEPDILYLDAQGRAISASIAETIKVTYAIAEQQTYVEGDNMIVPVVVGSVTEDSNFVFTPVAGRVHMIFPENTLYVSAVDMEAVVDEKLEFSFVGGALYKTLQVYRINTGNGLQPTKTLTVALEPTADIIGETVYVVAVYPDGSRALVHAKMTEDGITFEDTQFAYALIVQEQNWPYYAIAVLAVLVILAIIGWIIHAKKRIKVRGKKVKEPKAPKEPKPRAPRKARAPKATSAPKVAPHSEAKEIVATPEADTVSVPASETPVVEPVVEPTKKGRSPKGEKPAESTVCEKEAVAVPLEPTEVHIEPKEEAKPRKGKGTEPKVAAPRSAKPKATPAGAVVPRAPKEDAPAVPTLGTLGSDDWLAPPPVAVGDDDDEIIVSAVSRRADDDE